MASRGFEGLDELRGALRGFEGVQGALKGSRGFDGLRVSIRPTSRGLQAGCCLVRDVRLLHGGTKNEHGQPRHTTGFVVTSGEMMRKPHLYRVQRTLTDPIYARLKLDEVYRDHRCFDYIRNYDSSYASDV